MLQHLRQQARRELLAESRKHAITAKLRQIPYLGPIRVALAVALIQTPHRHYGFLVPSWSISSAGFTWPRWHVVQLISGVRSLRPSMFLKRSKMIV
jgi:hypothetical protein